MLKKIISPVFILPYLTVCGAGYHISFWNQFGLNGLNFISLSDIIKSAAQPIATPLIFLLLLVFLMYLSFYALLRLMKIPSEAIHAKTELKFETWLWIPILISIMGYFWVFFYYEDPTRWMAYAQLISGALLYLLIFNGFLIDEIPNLLHRFSSTFLIVTVPILSYSLGIMDAEYIVKNIDYQYTVISIDDSSSGSSQDTLKLIGFTTQNVIFSSLDNGELLILDRNIDTLCLKSKKIPQMSKYFMLVE